MERDGRDAAQRKKLAVAEKMIELRSVAGKFGTFVEYRSEGLLDGQDIPADRDPAAQPFLQKRCGGQMIRMRMRLENPFNLQMFRLDKGDQSLRRCRRGPS